MLKFLTTALVAFEMYNDIGLPGWLPKPLALVYHAWRPGSGTGILKSTRRRRPHLTITVYSTLVEPTTGHYPVVAGGDPCCLERVEIRDPTVIDPVSQIITKLARRHKALSERE